MASITPIIMFGAAGRMGRMILECAASSDRPFQVVAALDRAEHPSIGQPLATLIPSAPPGLLLTDSLPESVPEGTVTIDFTTPESTMAMLDWIEATGASAVIGTTGLEKKHMDRITETANKVPVVFAPNMSVGVNVLYELVAKAVELLGDSYDVEIIEMHHRFKRDAPSGTAKRLADVVIEARGGDRTTEVLHGRMGITGERTSSEIGMHCIRGGDVVGDHTVSFSTLGERVELTHKASTRETFARGALRAAEWVSGKEPGLYSMKDVLGI